MNRNYIAEYVRSMDSITFPPTQKEAMLHALQTKLEEQHMNKQNFTRRRFVVLAAAAAILLVSLTGAAVFTRWSQTAQQKYNPSEEIKEQAKSSGLSVMLEESKDTKNSNEVLSVTDQGITITAVQTLVDNYHAEIVFRIEGFDLPENELPDIWPVISIDGDKRFGGLQSGWFYDGLTTNEKGDTVYASTGLPVQTDEEGCLILDLVANDGSLEYTHYISFEETDGRYFGKEIVCHFQSIGFQSHEKAGMPIPQVEGNWELKWTLTGTSDSLTITPKAKIGDSNVILLDAQIGQKTIRARYQVDEYWEGWNELVTLPQAVYGVRMKDGSEYICGAGTAGFEDQENMIYFTEWDISDGILDVNQVDSLVFHFNDTKYYMPIK